MEKTGGVLKLSYRRFIELIRALYFNARYPELRTAFGIDSHLSLSERTKLYELATGVESVVEIGSYTGASACCFGAALLGKGGGKILCIDTWNNDAMTEGSRDTEMEFLGNTKEYDSLITQAKGFSTMVVDQVAVQVGHIDLLFIDGDHSYDGVKADWESYKGFLVKGSVVVFHDYGWAQGVQKVVQDDVLPSVSSHGRLPNMWWGTISSTP